MNIRQCVVAICWFGATVFFHITSVECYIPLCRTGCWASDQIGTSLCRRMDRGRWWQYYTPGRYTDNRCCPGYCGSQCTTESFGRLSYYVKKNEFKIKRLEGCLTRIQRPRYTYVPTLNGNRHLIKGPKGDAGAVGPKGEPGLRGPPGLPGAFPDEEKTEDVRFKEISGQVAGLNNEIRGIKRNMPDVEKMERVFKKQNKLTENYKETLKRISGLENRDIARSDAQNQTNAKLIWLEGVVKNQIASKKKNEIFEEMKTNISNIVKQVSDNNNTLHDVMLQVSNLSNMDVAGTVGELNNTVRELHQLIKNRLNTSKPIFETVHILSTLGILDERNRILNQTITDMIQTNIVNEETVERLQTSNVLFLDEITQLKIKNNELNNSIRDLQDVFLKTSEMMMNSISDCQTNITHLSSVKHGIKDLRKQLEAKNETIEELLSKNSKLSTENQQLNLLIQMYNGSLTTSGDRPFEDTEDGIMDDTTILSPFLNGTKKPEPECYCVCCADGKPFPKAFPKPPPVRPGYKPFPDIGDLAGLCTSIMEHSAEKRSAVGKKDVERKISDYFYLYDEYMADNVQADAIKASEPEKLVNSKSSDAPAYQGSSYAFYIYATFMCIVRLTVTM